MPSDNEPPGWVASHFLMTDLVICIEFERLKRLLVSAQWRRETAMNRADFSAAEATWDNITTLSELIFDHALKCGICDASVTRMN